MKNGIEVIAEERLRQINDENWSAEHDDQFKAEELARAAAAYALPDKFRDKLKNGRPKLFPFSVHWWKPASFSEKEGKYILDRKRQLAKAGALIAAEIDRLIRLEASSSQED